MKTIYGPPKAKDLSHTQAGLVLDIGEGPNQPHAKSWSQSTAGYRCQSGVGDVLSAGTCNRELAMVWGVVSLKGQSPVYSFLLSLGKPQSGLPCSLSEEPAGEDTKTIILGTS